MPLKINRTNLSEHLLEYQLQMIGKTVKEAISDENWIRDWSFTKEQSEQFKSYAIPLIKKTLKCNRLKATKAFDFFSLQFGLKIKS